MTNIPPVYIGENNETSLKVYYQDRQPPDLYIQQLPPPPIKAISSHQPESCICPVCHELIITRIKRTNGVVVWLASAGICLLGFALGCCLIPFFIDGIKDTTHYCPNCNSVIGRKKRL